MSDYLEDFIGNVSVPEDVESQAMRTYLLHAYRDKHPFVAVSKEHADYMKEVCDEAGLKVTIKHDTRIDISCKHYPFTCSEADIYYADTHNSSVDGCSCIGPKVCDGPDEYYWPFSWGDAYMRHCDNCYNDCCCISTIYNRYVLSWSCEIPPYHRNSGGEHVVPQKAEI